MRVRDQIKRLLYLSLYAIFQRSRLFWLPFVLIPPIIIVNALVAQKQYVNHATILIEESSLLNPFLDDLSFSFELEERMAALNTLVLSRKVLTQVAKDAQLVDENASIKQIEEMQQKLSQALSLQLVGDELVKIHFKWHERAVMKIVLEKVVEHFIERLLAPTKASLDTSEQFFAEQLNYQRKELEQAEDLLAQFKQEHSELLPELLNENREALQQIEKQKQLKKVALSGAKARLQSLIDKLGKANPVIGAIEERIVRVESELVLLKARYTDKHSKVVAKYRELSSLKKRQKELVESKQEFDTDNLDQLWQIANALPDSQNGTQNLLVSQIVSLQDAKNEVEQIKQEFEMLNEQAKEISVKMYQSSDIEKKLRKLERDYSVKSDLYQDMLSRYEMAKVTGKLVRYEGPDKVKTIERAYSPTQPINTPIVMVCILAVVVGVFAGFSFVFVAELSDSRLKDNFRIEQFTGLPIAAKLPVVNDEEFDQPITSRGYYEQSI
ncbi:GumC family protein (plasmid) [Catenovulum sp. SX2]|uniref:GumC family protein n=1 Tax=Catenovulum sp. SX2 TaxID=3398614 RepID=UPI003F84B4AF